jgi:hypothetical protein
MDWQDLTSGDQERARRMAMRALRVYFAEKRWSRLAMAFILLFTGAGGVAASWVMLTAGLGAMWVRYPLAVFIAWIAFLALVWLWMQVERRHFTADEKMAELLKGRDPGEAMARLKDNDASVLDWFTEIPDFTDDEGCIVLTVALALLCLVFFAIIAIFNVLAGAPILFAEVFIDAVLIGALYKRIKPLHEQWWVLGAARQTWRPVALTAGALLLLAVLFAYLAPGAKSVGGVIVQLQGRSDPASMPLERP